MFLLRKKDSGSWLDPESSRLVAWKCGQRLWKRCEGRRGLFVTLTYRRDEYQNSLDLYRRASEEQHVPLLLRKIARRLKVSLKGKWFCKLEFQRGGWVHWHLIILDVDRIDHAELHQLWGRGFVWLKRLTKRNCEYACKYVAKGNALPAWLYLEKPRSVKVIRVSPGFWGEPSRPPKEPDPYDEYGPGQGTIVDAFVPIGVKLRAERGCVARRLHRRISLGVSMPELVTELNRRGVRVLGPSWRGWLVFDGTLQQVEDAANACRGRRPQAARGTRAALHSNSSSNPDAPPVYEWPPHLDAWFRERAEEEADLGEEARWAGAGIVDSSGRVAPLDGVRTLRELGR